MADYSRLTTESINEKTKNIDKMSAIEIAKVINDEDKTVAFAVEKALPQIAAGIDMLADSLKCGGHIYYCGAGTSGRLGVLDAAECPPTYGVGYDAVVGLMAGGVDAPRVNPRRTIRSLSSICCAPASSECATCLSPSARAAAQTVLSAL